MTSTKWLCTCNINTTTNKLITSFVWQCIMFWIIMPTMQPVKLVYLYQISTLHGKISTAEQLVNINWHIPDTSTHVHNACTNMHTCMHKHAHMHARTHTCTDNTHFGCHALIWSSSLNTHCNHRDTYVVCKCGKLNDIPLLYVLFNILLTTFYTPATIHALINKTQSSARARCLWQHLKQL